MALGRNLNIGNLSIPLLSSCTTEHTLNVQIDDELSCAPLTTSWIDNSLHVAFNDITYTVCNGTCPTQNPGDPPTPVVITDCEWEQTNSNAYLLSNGNQWFDTLVPVDSSVNIDMAAQVINGKHARIFGTKGSTCHFDVTMNKSGGVVFRFGTNTSAVTSNFSTAEAKGKVRYYTETGSATRKWFRAVTISRTRSNYRDSAACTSPANTILVFDNDLINSANLDPTQSGGLKLYYIKMYDANGELLHHYQPVAAGTDLCGYTAPTNGMWDTVTKQFYQAGGTGSIGYGVDP